MIKEEIKNELKIAILQEFREEFKLIVREEIVLGIREFASRRRTPRASNDSTQPEVYLPKEGKEKH